MKFKIGQTVYLIPSLYESYLKICGSKAFANRMLKGVVYHGDDVSDSTLFLGRCSAYDKLWLSKRFFQLCPKNLNDLVKK